MKAKIRILEYILFIVNNIFRVQRYGSLFEVELNMTELLSSNVLIKVNLKKFFLSDFKIPEKEEILLPYFYG